MQIRARAGIPARSAVMGVVSLQLLAAALMPLRTNAQSPGIDSGYIRNEERVPMRDGVRLFTVILTPKRAVEPLPILLSRTPYGTANWGGTMDFDTAFAELARDGYVFVFQDIRGRFGSDGTFEMNRLPHSGPQGTDESTDTYDTIEWLVHHVPHTIGRVGILGISYPGWLAAVAGIGAHPALKAISPQAPMGDTWMGDDFFHQGAFRLSYGLEYSWELEAVPGQTTIPGTTRYDTYDWYGSFPTLGALAGAVGAARWPTWRRFVAHPAYDTAWSQRALSTTFPHTTVPTLVVGGWWDQEDEYGALLTYATLARSDTAHVVSLVMGPWNHGQWYAARGESLGNLEVGRATGVDFRALQARWFGHWLHDRADSAGAAATVFDAGTNVWRQFNAWPPKTSKPTRLYLRDHGRLSFDPPTEQTGADQYVSDPAHPVPYRPRPVERTYAPTSRWSQWLTEDQRFVQNRPDVLAWQTAPLDHDVAIAGNVVAHLFASTSGSDADWVVKLIDVYPDTVRKRPSMGGYELMVTGDILRGRYRTSFAQPTPIPAGRAESYAVDLHQQSYTFRRGHRIMVQVQSSWFPLYDRNPQTFVPNIFLAQPEDYQTRVHRVHRSAEHASYVSMDVDENH